MIIEEFVCGQAHYGFSLSGGYEAQHSREAELNVGGSVGGSVGQQVGQNSEVDVWSTPQHDPLSPYSNHHHHHQHAAYYAQVHSTCFIVGSIPCLGSTISLETKSCRILPLTYVKKYDSTSFPT